MSPEQEQIELAQSSEEDLTSKQGTHEINILDHRFSSQTADSLPEHALFLDDPPSLELYFSHKNRLSGLHSHLATLEAKLRTRTGGVLASHPLVIDFHSFREQQKKELAQQIEAFATSAHARLLQAKRLKGGQYPG